MNPLVSTLFVGIASGLSIAQTKFIFIILSRVLKSHDKCNNDLVRDSNTNVRDMNFTSVAIGESAQNPNQSKISDVPVGPANGA